MDWSILNNEITLDPLAKGYAGMTDQQVVDTLNLSDIDAWQALSSAQIFEAIVPSEFAALSDANKTRVDRVLGLGSGIQTSPSSNARAEMLSVFGGGSVTISNLAAIARIHICRGEEIGWGMVSLVDVQRVRGA